MPGWCTRATGVFVILHFMFQWTLHLIHCYTTRSELFEYVFFFFFFWINTAERGFNGSIVQHQRHFTSYDNHIWETDNHLSWVQFCHLHRFKCNGPSLKLYHATTTTKCHNLKKKKKKIIGAIQLMPPQLQWVSITKKTVNCNQLQRSNDYNKWIRNK